MTPKQRAKYMECTGAHWAGLGGTFGTYRMPEDAWPVTSKFLLGLKDRNFTELTDEDYKNFEGGFLAIQALRVELQLELAQFKKEFDDELLRELEAE